MMDKSVLTKRVVIFSAIVVSTAVAGMTIAGLIGAVDASARLGGFLLGPLIGALLAQAAVFFLSSRLVRDAWSPFPPCGMPPFKSARSPRDPGQ